MKQAGFTAMDHLQVVNEYQQPLCLGFVDKGKAFDAFNHNAVFNTLQTKRLSEVGVLASLYI